MPVPVLADWPQAVIGLGHASPPPRSRPTANWASELRSCRLEIILHPCPLDPAHAWEPVSLRPIAPSGFIRCLRVSRSVRFRRFSRYVHERAGAPAIGCVSNVPSVVLLTSVVLLSTHRPRLATRPGRSARCYWRSSSAAGPLRRYLLPPQPPRLAFEPLPDSSLSSWGRPHYPCSILFVGAAGAVAC